MDGKESKIPLFELFSALNGKVFNILNDGLHKFSTVPSIFIFLHLCGVDVQ